MYKRRIIAFLAFILVVLIILIARLFYIQICKADYYLAAAEDYLNRPRVLPAMRGKVLDRAGLILAFDEPCHDLCLDFRFMISRQKWLTSQGRASAGDDRLSTLAVRWIERQQRDISKAQKCSPGRAEKVFRRRWENTWQVLWKAAESAGQDLTVSMGRQVSRVCRMTRDGKRNYRELHIAHPVVTGLSREIVGQVLPELPETVGLVLRPSHSRRYPRGASASHVIGLTGPVSEQDVRANRPRFEPDWLTWHRDSYLSNDLIGKTGVEKLCEAVLRGQRGYVNCPVGKPVGEPVEAVAGKDVHLTVDMVLQESLSDAFDRHVEGKAIRLATGAIVVLDVPTGHVLALVSVPTFDLNDYRAEYKRLLGEKVRLPLRHRAIAQCHPPGSTVKPIVAMAAIADGRITPGTEFTCNMGVFPLSSDGRPKCWAAKHNFGHGRIDLSDAIRFSCNVYFDHVGNLMGPASICEWYRLFGFGMVTGTGLPEEASGLVPTDAWMRRAYNRPLLIGDAWNMAIGQGSLAASPLQVANAMSTVARGGICMSPVIVLEGGPKRVTNHLPIGGANVAAVHKGMRDVVHSSGGTANKELMKAGLGELGFEFCGKTGTAQVPPQKIDADGDGKADTEVRWGDVAWFSGFAPYRNPQIAFAVMVEYVEGGASEYAAPLALEVVRICDRMGYVTVGGG